MTMLVAAWTKFGPDLIEIMVLCRLLMGSWLGIGTSSIINWDASVSKSDWSYVGIFRFFLDDLRCILCIPLHWSVICLKSWTSTVCFSNSTGSSITTGQSSMFIVSSPKQMKTIVMLKMVHEIYHSARVVLIQVTHTILPNLKVTELKLQLSDI